MQFAIPRHPRQPFAFAQAYIPSSKFSRPCLFIGVALEMDQPQAKRARISAKAKAAAKTSTTCLSSPVPAKRVPGEAGDGQAVCY